MPGRGRRQRSSGPRRTKIYTFDDLFFNREEYPWNAPSAAGPSPAAPRPARTPAAAAAASRVPATEVRNKVRNVWSRKQWPQAPPPRPSDADKRQEKRRQLRALMELEHITEHEVNVEYNRIKKARPGLGYDEYRTRAVKDIIKRRRRQASRNTKPKPQWDLDTKLQVYRNRMKIIEEHQITQQEFNAEYNRLLHASPDLTPAQRTNAALAALKQRKPRLTAENNHELNVQLRALKRLYPTLSRKQLVDKALELLAARTKKSYTGKTRPLAKGTRFQPRAKRVRRKPKSMALVKK